LKQAKVPATFFIVGNWAEKNGDIVRQIAADGHDLGNHSYNHPNFTTLSDEQIIAQLVTTDDIIERETGCTSRPFVRAPYGALNPNVLRVMAQAGFESIFWSAHGGDWLPGMTTESVRQTVDKLAGNGGIIVLHSSVPETAQAVPQIVQDLRARGLEFVRLSELLAPDPAHPYRAPCKPKL
jgi:peptidoglycan/xylan/chitin deacetylase (PgdA/CDA1 family)